jgi:hypothetical protein
VDVLVPGHCKRRGSHRHEPSTVEGRATSTPQHSRQGIVPSDVGVVTSPVVEGEMEICW